MRTFRNTFFLFVVIYLFVITLLYTVGRQLSAHFYFVSFILIVSFIIVIEVIYNFNVSNDMKRIQRGLEKLQLAIQDAELESKFLSTLTEIIETFNEEVSLHEILHTIASSLRNLFKEETIVLQLLGDDFKKVVEGKNIDFTGVAFAQVTDKAHPVLINNTASFSSYKMLKEQGVTSCVFTPFHPKRNVVGFIGVFSFNNKQFTIHDLTLLRNVAAPTALLIENAVLFDRTKILAMTDSLTQLYNRRHFEDNLHMAIADAEKKGLKVSLCIADVDFFKHYNDLNGHQAGDIVLKKIAQILKQSVKGSDIVGRYGGEEFIIIFPETDKNYAVKICETIRTKVKEYEFYNEKAQPNNDLTISFGVATYPDDAKNADVLIKQADLALYKAKQGGRDRVMY